jgi:bifunctional non-homologous end joining protein LigD
VSLDRAAGLLEVDGQTVRITSPERILYPRVGWTKGRMLEYYARIAPAMLSHIADRPVSLRRFPEGVEGPTWYQTRCGPGRPEYVRTCVLEVPRGEPQDYCVIDDVAGLLWAANLSAVELHPLLMRAADPTVPTAVVFDLDPGPGAGLGDCCRVATVLRDALASVGLRSFAKTSGSAGVHVVVPVNGPVTFERTKAFARVVATSLAEADPSLVVHRQARHLRPGKVLVDWLQNDHRRSTVAPYSLRAGVVPVVSMPVTWDEVEDARGGGDERLWFSPVAALERVDADGDAFALVQTLRQELPGV